MKTVPLRVIASKLGCSRSTVSYALRNIPCISPEMRSRVQAMARDLGWTPDAELAKHLALVRATGKRGAANLALLINKPVQELVEQHSPRKHLAGATARARDLGYNLEVFNLAETPLSPARLNSVLQARGIEGIVYLATLEPHALFTPDYLAIGRLYACASVAVRFRDPPYHVAISDQFSSGSLAVEELLKEGYRRPGAVLPRGLDQRLGWGFGGGLHAGAIAQLPSERIPTCYVGRDETYLPESTFPQIAAWIRQEAPDVLITTDVHYLRKFLNQKRKAMTHLKVCSLDYHMGLAVDFGIDQRSEEVGAAAVDLVVAQIHRGESGIPETQHALQIEGRWVGEHTIQNTPRPSLGKPFKLPL